MSMLSCQQWIDASIDPGAASRLLRLAALHGHVDDMVRLLALGADPNRIESTDARDLPDSNPGKSCLHYAAWHGRVRAVELLLSAGASPNATRLHGDTPLLEWVRGVCNATRDGSAQHDQAYHHVAVLLLRAGANPQLGRSSSAGCAWDAASTKGVLPRLVLAMAEAGAFQQAEQLEFATPPATQMEDARRL